MKKDKFATTIIDTALTGLKLVSPVAFLGGKAVKALGEKAVKALFQEDEVDIVMLMGPQKAGKTEILSAINRKSYDADRVGTGAQITENPFGCYIYDSGGEFSNIFPYINGVFKQLEHKNCRHLFIVLVADASKVEKQNVGKISEELAIYINSIRRTIEPIKRLPSSNRKELRRSESVTKMYLEGHYGYSILWTHSDTVPERTNNTLLAQVASYVKVYKGKIRSLDGKVPKLVDLTKAEQRDEMLGFLWRKLEILQSKI